MAHPGWMIQAHPGPSQLDDVLNRPVNDRIMRTPHRPRLAGREGQSGVGLVEPAHPQTSTVTCKMPSRNALPLPVRVSCGMYASTTAVGTGWKNGTDCMPLAELALEQEI
jgi:hypothetical protein